MIRYMVYDPDMEYIIADNLSIEDAIDCKSLRPGTVIKESSTIYRKKTQAQEYKEAWVEYFAQLQAMGNIN